MSVAGVVFVLLNKLETEPVELLGEIESPVWLWWFRMTMFKLEVVGLNVWGRVVVWLHCVRLEWEGEPMRLSGLRLGKKRRRLPDIHLIDINEWLDLKLIRYL